MSLLFNIHQMNSNNDFVKYIDHNIVLSVIITDINHHFIKFLTYGGNYNSFRQFYYFLVIFITVVNFSLYIPDNFHAYAR